MERVVEKCVVLGSTDCGEADRVVSLFSEQRGLLRAFAAHARKSQKRFGGALEPFTLVNAALVERRGELYRFERAEIVEAFSGIRADLGEIARAGYACELTRELCREKEPHPELFAELVDLLFRLSRRTSTPEDLLVFELGALAWAGLRPALDDCTGCGRKECERFDAEVGGLLCADCARKVPGTRAISTDAASALRNLQSGTRAPQASAVRREARAHLERFIAHHLGKPLRAAEFMRELALE